MGATNSLRTNLLIIAWTSSSTVKIWLRTINRGFDGSDFDRLEGTLNLDRLSSSIHQSLLNPLGLSYTASEKEKAMAQRQSI